MYEYSNGTNQCVALSESTMNSIRNVLTQIIRYGTKDYTFKISDNIKCLKKKDTNNIKIFSRDEQQKVFQRTELYACGISSLIN